MAKIEITKTELMWPGKYNEDGTRKEVERINLPFQVIERINETRATREAAKKPKQSSLFDLWQAKEGDTFQEGWKNKLIWGENLLVMGSLLENFAGKIDLIYIDPPFATGADFSFTAEIGDGELEVTKKQSIIEEKAYRDTWGMGLTSYCQIIYDRLILAHQLLSDSGLIFLHIGSDIQSHVRLLMEDILGPDCFKNCILARRGRKNLQGQFATIDSLMRDYDAILLYSKSQTKRLPKLTSPREELREGTWNNHWRGTDRPTMRYALFGIIPERGQWRWSEERSIEAIKNYEDFLKVRNKYKSIDEYWSEHFEKYGVKLDFLRLSSTGKPEHYVPPSEESILGDIWFDISTYARQYDYPTEKSEELLQRIITWTSSSGSLVADFFCGSGTTIAVAEKLGRRWIGCDLSRYAVHVSRKRLLGIENCKPFEVLNLGKYERKYWQGVTFGDKKKSDQQLAIYQYLAFILKLYGAEPISGMQHLHGKKGKAVVHVGAVDAPVTIDEINACLDECLAIQQKELHVLGWEWEMGLYDLMTDAAKGRGVKLVLLNIPREVMEQQAVDKGDIKFFELAYLEVDIKQEKGRKITISLKDFVIPNTELVPEEIRSKIKKWSDYIDYWSVDWDFQNDTFMNGWVTYRTRKDRALALKSDVHTYEKTGKYTVMVKVVDIFGNDTSQAFEVEAK